MSVDGTIRFPDGSEAPLILPGEQPEPVLSDEVFEEVNTWGREVEELRTLFSRPGPLHDVQVWHLLKDGNWVQRAGTSTGYPLRQIDLTRVEGKSYEEVAELWSEGDEPVERLVNEMVREFRRGVALGAALTLALGLTWAVLDRLWQR